MSPYSPKLKMFVLVFIIQIVIVTYLGLMIYNKRDSKILGVNYVPMAQKDLVYNPDSTLTYYYEPAPNSIEHPTLFEILPPEPASPEWPLYAVNATYTTNNDSLFERFNYSLEKTDNTFRIITLGDSFTQGAFVETKYSYPEILEDLLNKQTICEDNKFEVINLGVGGYDIQYSVERYKLRGQKYSPDLIIWLLKADDFYEILEIMGGLQMKYEKEIGVEKVYELALKGEYPHIDKALRDFFNIYDEASLLDYQKNQIERLITLANNKILIVGTPLKEEHLAILERLEEKYSDLFSYTDGLDLSSDDRLILPDNHPSKEGYQLIANYVYNYLVVNNYLPCQQSY